MELANVIYEKELPEQMRSGDHSTFTRLYEQHASKVFGYLISRTNSTEKAELLLMEVFSRVWEQIASFGHNGEKKVMLILFSICRDNEVSIGPLSLIKESCKKSVAF